MTIIPERWRIRDCLEVCVELGAPGTNAALGCDFLDGGRVNRLAPKQVAIAEKRSDALTSLP
jgi:hypothetical protein